MCDAWTGSASTAQDEIEEQETMNREPVSLKDLEIRDHISAAVACSFWFKEVDPVTDSGVLRWWWFLRPMTFNIIVHICKVHSYFFTPTTGGEAAGLQLGSSGAHTKKKGEQSRMVVSPLAK